jgi:hypothetical protein
MRQSKESAAEINPYASPATASDMRAEEGPGVGVWRDGPHMVMHQAARLPPICIETGEHATDWRRFNVIWYYPIDWSQRVLPLDLPLSPAAYARHGRLVLIGRVVLFSPIIVLVLTFMAAGQVAPAWLFGVLGIAALCGVLGWYVVYFLDGRPVRFVRVRRGYLWLSGFNSRFLDHLPPWQQVM